MNSHYAMRARGYLETACRDYLRCRERNMRNRRRANTAAKLAPAPRARGARRHGLDEATYSGAQ